MAWGSFFTILVGQTVGKIRPWAVKDWPRDCAGIRENYDGAPYPSLPPRGSLGCGAIATFPCGEERRMPEVRRKSSPGAVLHAPGRPITDIPRPKRPESAPHLSQFPKIPRLFQTAPGQFFMPWGVLLPALQTEFPKTRSTQQNKKIHPHAVRHGDVRTINRYRAYPNTNTQTPVRSWVQGLPGRLFWLLFCRDRKVTPTVFSAL